MDSYCQARRLSNNPLTRAALTVGQTPELIRARHVIACAQAKQAMGRNSDALLKRVGFSSGCLSDPAALVPLAYFERFLSVSCAAAEIGTFAYSVAPSDLSIYRGLVGQLAGFATLRQALERGAVGTAEITNQSIRIGTWQQKTWLYTMPLSRDAGRLAWSPYLLKPLMALARAVAGDAWWPQSVQLPCPRVHDLESLDFCEYSSVDFDMRAVAVEISAKLPDATWASSIAGDFEAVDVNGEIPNDLIGSVRALLRTFSHDRPLQLSTIAELAGCSVRSLQRELRRAGFSYTALSQEARYLAAVRLLAETDSTVTDVAYELGYSDPAHFTRAFRRNSGASPRAFRELGHAMV